MAAGGMAPEVGAVRGRAGPGWHSARHLKVLQRAGLITSGRDAQWQPRRLEPKRLRELAEWVEQYRRH
jgi:hypothetical protein